MNKKLLFYVMGAILTMPAIADERGVVSRTDCDAANAQIADLRAIENPDADTVAKLEKLTARVRRDCMARNIRATSGRTNAAQQNADADAAAGDATPDNADVVADAPEIEAVTLDPAVVQQNLDAGLCADGTKPNKYGCCTDEVFRDMGGMNFACCPKSGGDCFPPISNK